MKMWMQFNVMPGTQTTFEFRNSETIETMKNSKNISKTRQCERRYVNVNVLYATRLQLSVFRTTTILRRHCLK